MNSMLGIVLGPGLPPGAPRARPHPSSSWGSGPQEASQEIRNPAGPAGAASCVPGPRPPARPLRKASQLHCREGLVCAHFPDEETEAWGADVGRSGRAQV